MYMLIRVLSSCTSSQEPIQKTQQSSTAKQRFVKNGVHWLFPLCIGTPGYNSHQDLQNESVQGASGPSGRSSLSHFLKHVVTVGIPAPPGLDPSQSQGYPPALSLLVAIYTPAWRECLAQEHNTASPARTIQSEDQCTNH